MAKRRTVKKKSTFMCECGCHNYLAIGIGLFIFGLIKYLGYNWEIAFMVIGILAFLKGLYIYSKK